MTTERTKDDLIIWHQHRIEDLPHIQQSFKPLTVKDALKLIWRHDLYARSKR